MIRRRSTRCPAWPPRPSSTSSARPAGPRPTQLFVQLMTAHHQGGIHMADVRRAARQRVRGARPGPPDQPAASRGDHRDAAAAAGQHRRLTRRRGTADTMSGVRTSRDLDDLDPASKAARVCSPACGFVPLLSILLAGAAAGRLRHRRLRRDRHRSRATTASPATDPTTTDGHRRRRRPTPRRRTPDDPDPGRTRRPDDTTLDTIPTDTSHPGARRPEHHRLRRRQDPAELRRLPDRRVQGHRVVLDRPVPQAVRRARSSRCRAGSSPPTRRAPRRSPAARARRPATRTSRATRSTAATATSSSTTTTTCCPSWSSSSGESVRRRRPGPRVRPRHPVADRRAERADDPQGAAGRLLRRRLGGAHRPRRGRRADLRRQAS